MEEEEKERGGERRGGGGRGGGGRGEGGRGGGGRGEGQREGGGGRGEGGRGGGGGGRGGEDCVTTVQGHTPTPPAYLFAGLLQLWLQGFQLSLHACHLVCG